MKINFESFVNYLFNIGVVGSHSVKDFFSFYQKEIKNQLSSNISEEVLHKIIYSYFENVDEESLNMLCRELIQKYKDNVNKSNVKKAKQLFLPKIESILAKSQLKKDKMTLKKYLQVWTEKVRKLVMMTKKENKALKCFKETNLKEQKTLSTNYVSKPTVISLTTCMQGEGEKFQSLNNSLVNQNVSSPKMSQKTHIIRQSSIRKETLDIRDSIGIPNKDSRDSTIIAFPKQAQESSIIHHNNNASMIDCSILDEVAKQELGLDSPKIENKAPSFPIYNKDDPNNSDDSNNISYYTSKLRNKSKPKEKGSSSCSYRKLNKSQAKNSSKVNDEINSSLVSASIINTFLERQVERDKITNKAKEKIIREIEDEITLNCTFKPQILPRKQSSVSNLQPAHLRLYEDPKKKQPKKMKEIEENKDKEVAKRKNPALSELDRKKMIENLYQDHNERQNKREVLKKSIEEELGYTYKPTIREPSKEMKIVIKSTFDERNKKLKDQKKKLEDESKAREIDLSILKDSKVNEELIYKLYERNLDKVKEKNQLPHREKTNFNFEKNYLRNYDSSTQIEDKGQPNRILIASAKTSRENNNHRRSQSPPNPSPIKTYIKEKLENFEKIEELSSPNPNNIKIIENVKESRCLIASPSLQLKVVESKEETNLILDKDAKKYDCNIDDIINEIHDVASDLIPVTVTSSNLSEENYEPKMIELKECMEFVKQENIETKCNRETEVLGKEDNKETENKVKKEPSDTDNIQGINLVSEKQENTINNQKNTFTIPKNIETESEKESFDISRFLQQDVLTQNRNVADTEEQERINKEQLNPNKFKRKARDKSKSVSQAPSTDGLQEIQYKDEDKDQVKHKTKVKKTLTDEELSYFLNM